jgi:cell division protein FtsL
MIQLNMLPDIKIEFMRLSRIKRLVIAVTVVVIAVSAVVLISLISLVYGVQKNNLHNLNSSIIKYQAQIVNTSDLDKILTIQNQLAALPNLENNKPVVTRLFGYIQQLTPANITISDLTIDFTAHTIQVSGNSTGGIASVDQFVDTFKFSTYTTSSTSPSLNVFSNVVLTSFGLSQGVTSYGISANYDPNIFSSTYSNIQINVPSEYSTRSITQQPIFNTLPKSSTTP